MAENEPDPRVQNFTFDVEADMKAQEILGNMGIKDADDLGQGRADVGLIARHINERMDPQMDPDLMDTISRDAEWARQAGTPEQPQPRPTGEPSATPPQDRLAQLQAQMESIVQERDTYKEKLEVAVKSAGSRRLRRLESQLEQLTSRAVAPQTYNAIPPQAAGLDPSQPMTAADVWNLMMAQSQAFGTRIDGAIKQAVTAARATQGYSLTADQEETLLDSHPWLESLPIGEREQAMMTLAKPNGNGSRPAVPPGAVPPPVRPQGVDLLELARQKHLTATTFIEPSSRGSAPERDAVTGVDSNLAKKIAEYRDAIQQRPGQKGAEFDQFGSNVKAERLLREISSLQRRRG